MDSQTLHGYTAALGGVPGRGGRRASLYGRLADRLRVRTLQSRIKDLRRTRLPFPRQDLSTSGLRVLGFDGCGLGLAQVSEKEVPVERGEDREEGERDEDI